MIFNIELNENDLAVISHALENMPYKAVVHLIVNISEQVQKQQEMPSNDH